MRSRLATALLAAAVSLASLFSSVRVSAQEVRPQPEVSLFYQSLTAARANPLGLVSLLDMTLRLRLFESDSAVLAQNFAGIGITGGLSPAFGRAGVLAEIQPLTIVRVFASYEVVGYFSSFNLFASFPSALSEFSDTAIRERPGAGLPGYVTHGGWLTLGAVVQARVGPIAARNQARAVHASFQMRDGDRVFYDQLTDMLVPNDGWILTNELDVVGMFDIGLNIGARWSYGHAFYESRHVASGEDPNAIPDNDLHRLGLIATYTFEDNEGARFDRPTLVLILQWHLQHRYRTGADVHVGAPYAALAFQFVGDILSPREAH